MTNTRGAFLYSGRAMTCPARSMKGLIPVVSGVEANTVPVCTSMPARSARERPNVLAELKSDSGSLGLDTLLAEIGKLSTVRAGQRATGGQHGGPLPGKDGGPRVRGCLSVCI